MSTSSDRVLVVHDGADPRGAIGLLEHRGCAVVATATPTDDLSALAAEHQPDIVLIDVERLPRTLLLQITAMHRLAARPVAAVVRDHPRHSVSDTIDAGISALHVGPINAEQISVLIESARAHFDHDLHLRQQLDQARTALSERKVVERAKGILMDQRGLSEAEAYRRLRTLAMNRKRRIADVAQDVIDMADILGNEATT